MPWVKREPRSPRPEGLREVSSNGSAPRAGFRAPSGRAIVALVDSQGIPTASAEWQTTPRPTSEQAQGHDPKGTCQLPATSRQGDVLSRLGQPVSREARFPVYR